MLPPQEVDEAAVRIVRANYGASSSELVQALSRAFGFASTSAQLRATLGGRVEALVEAGTVVKTGEVLVLSK